MKKSIFAFGVIAVLVVLTIFNNIDFGKAEQNKKELPKIGYQAPSFTLEGLDGKSYSLAELDKPVVINFWASWCGPCNEEAPELVKLYEKYGDRVEIYAVDLIGARGETADDARDFVKHYGYSFPVPLDKKGKIGDLYGVLGIPTTFFVNEKGIIIQKVQGILPPEKLESLFEKLAKS